MKGIDWHSGIAVYREHNINTDISNVCSYNFIFYALYSNNAFILSKVAL